jgi:hypothetical protein
VLAAGPSAVRYLVAFGSQRGERWVSGAEDSGLSTSIVKEPMAGKESET